MKEKNEEKTKREHAWRKIKRGHNYWEGTNVIEIAYKIIILI
jgi:hypothetical protein